MGKIRIVVLSVFLWEDRILVYKGKSPDTGRIFFRPTGGGLEFGESLEEGLRREVMEEHGQEITDIVPLCVAQPRFKWHGVDSHQIFVIHDAKFRDTSYYREEWFSLNDNGNDIPCKWKPISDFRNGDFLHPQGLLEFLETYEEGKVCIPVLQ